MPARKLARDLVSVPNFSYVSIFLGGSRSRARFAPMWCALTDARVHAHGADVYNDTAKAAPHVSHYDFSALLLIKMQIYRGGGASEQEGKRERERERDRDIGR